jgi:hypothetical protein
MVKGKVEKGRKKKTRWSEFFSHCQAKRCKYTQDGKTFKKHEAFGLCENCYNNIHKYDKRNETQHLLVYQLKYYQEAVKQTKRKLGIKVFENSQEDYEKKLEEDIKKQPKVDITAEELEKKMRKSLGR